MTADEKGKNRVEEMKWLHRFAFEWKKTYCEIMSCFRTDTEKTNRWLYPLFLCFLLVAILYEPVYADLAPHPSVTVTIEGFPDNNVYGTLLSKTESYGPYSCDDIERKKPGDVEGAKAFDAFYDYALHDSFFFWGDIHFFQKGNYHWGYYPPEVFKVFIYDPVKDIVYASEEKSNYAFDSYYRVRLQDDGTLSVTETPHFETIICEFLIRVFITVLVELMIAILFGYRDEKSIKIIIAVNCITQVILNLTLSLFVFFDGPSTWDVLLPVSELIVFLIEAVVYSIWLKMRSKKRAVLYALVANIASLYIGLRIAG